MRQGLPTGTVTFLFTDVEGSTRLLHELGAEDYGQTLAEHRRRLREAFAGHGGVEVDTQGDAFFYVFPTAPEALEAAAEGQQALSFGPIGVRMGLHTGAPHLTDEGFVGVDVHRAARIAACAHGGQVLVSASTATLVGRDGLRDLGEHRLKDLSAPERIYQLGHGDFPPLRSLNQTNLPLPSTPFLGRAEEVGEVVELLRSESVRLLTLTGVGGTGKTRLALEAASELVSEYEHGVWWVPLAPLREPSLVLESAAQALGTNEKLGEYVGDRQLLFLFDNFEHLLEAAPPLGELLARCPNAKALVTSREPLHLSAEREYAVRSLAEAEATELFRARSVESGPEDVVAAICRRLDCLPLAVELAAARTKVLSLAAILERLERSLPLLTGGPRDAPERQQTLRATIAWSHDLLAADEQRLFARLSVFAGGCTLEAAETVCAADLDVLEALVDKSLVRRSGDRFSMLETIREFAAERLVGRHEGESLAGDHALHFLALAERAEPELRGGETSLWLERLKADDANLRAALSYTREAREHELHARLVGALGRYWYVLGRLKEGWGWLAEALKTTQQPALRAKLLTGATSVVGSRMDLDRAHAFADERLALCGALGDLRGAAEALNDLGKIASLRGEYGRARALLERGCQVAREADDRWGLALCTANLSELALNEGDYARAIADGKEAVELQQKLGDEANTASTLASVAYAALQLGQADEARSSAEETIRLGRRFGFRGFIVEGLEALGATAASTGHPEQAARLLGQAGRLSDEIGVVLTPFELDLHDRTIANLRDQLSPDAFDALWTEGSHMDLDQVLGSFSPMDWRD